MNDALAGRIKTSPPLRDVRAALGAVRALNPAPPMGSPAEALTASFADHSPYLWSIIADDPTRLARFLATSPENATAEINERLLALPLESDEETFVRALRRAKREAALLIALADVGGTWSLEETTAALSDFAEAAVRTALSRALAEAAQAGKITLSTTERTEKGSGLVVLALGKLGARELNYSSDVDLVVLFDHEKAPLPEGVAPGPVFVRIVQRMTKLLHERTADGYALRVDLRLRPDPGATPIAMAIDAAYSYYEALGQNWERAAMIKARPIAGDLDLGRRFLTELAPFIWRKYFDFAAIADVHAMKRQIHAVRGHDQVVVPGHDLKLGRGGIREIEFFVQTQQLIFGGRRPQLRGSRTLEMLEALEIDGWIDASAVRDLTEAYEYLRSLEHRLQMVSDEQTQRLPNDPDALARIASFAGFASMEEFEAVTTKRLRAVEAHYAKLFEEAPTLGSDLGSLVFTGVVDDPETLQTLRGLGFREPVAAAEIVRGWHFGRAPAMRSARARETLTELTPALLQAFSGSGDPDAALAAMDRALGRMSAAVELFSLLRSNAALREVFADILGAAPRLADAVATRPHLLDAAIDPGRANPSGDGIDEPVVTARALSVAMSARDFEQALDRTREFAAEERFRIGVRLLSGACDADVAGRAYSALAQGAVAAMVERAGVDFAAEHGHIEGGRFAVLAMGKLGSREMTAASDLDLILIHDFAEGAGESNGRKPLSPAVYFARLTQRILTALTAPTKAGKLYDVDLRLRPSGGKGPLATNLRAFRDYQRTEAETWEHMALTRARIVAGDAGLKAEVEAVVAEALHRSRDPAAVARDVVAMRKMIADAKGDSDPWDLKLVAGGLIDLEFVAQYLQLAFGSAKPEVLDVSTRAVFAHAAELGLLSMERSDELAAAHKLFTAATQMQRLTTDGRFDQGSAAEGVKRRIAATAGLPNFSAFVAAQNEARRAVRQAFHLILFAGDTDEHRRNPLLPAGEKGKGHM